MKLALLPKKERSIKLYHPWVFSGAFASHDSKPEEGDIVEVYSHEGEYLATGHFHNGSIKVRIFSFEQTDAGDDFWEKKLVAAYALRKSLGLTENVKSNSYRLVNGEGDGLSGLIIDVYGSAIVLQSHTIGMHRIKDQLLMALKNIYGNRIDTLFDKSADTMPKRDNNLVSNNFLLGDKQEHTILENEITFNVNWVEGQKTGFFLDQRENRLLLQRYSENKRVLNTFSYSGGFSMYALKGGAEYVHSIDSSKKAGVLSERNAEANNFSEKHAFFSSDAFDYLKKSKEKYDVIILDPPAFAKHISSVKNAMIGYRNLNTEGIKNITKGGMLFTFSCSQVIDRSLFRKLVFQAAAQAKRNVRILHQLSQSPDHPVSIYHPEGEYLKGLVLMVD